VERVQDPVLGDSIVIRNRRLRAALWTLPGAILVLAAVGGALVWLWAVTTPLDEWSPRQLADRDEFLRLPVAVPLVLIIGLIWLRSGLPQVTHRVRVLVGEKGCQWFPGPGPVLWTELAEVTGFETYYRGTTRCGVKILARDPVEFEACHRLSLIRHVLWRIGIARGRLDLPDRNTKLPFRQFMQAQFMQANGGRKPEDHKPDLRELEQILTSIDRSTASK
jgi:hypothetical protein